MGYRPTWLEIDLAAVSRNLDRLKSRLKSSRTAILAVPLRRASGTELKPEVLAVVKANGYGHGAGPVAGHLYRLGVRWFGVSSIEEGISLRSQGIQGRILILGSSFPFDASFQAAAKYRLALTISSAEAGRRLCCFAAKRNTPISGHIKMETGMQRIGARPETCLQIGRLLKECPKIKIEGVYTHFADARDRAFSTGQLVCFKRGLVLLRENGIYPQYIHAANSAASLRYPESHFDLIRPGLALYGGMPGFEPAASLKTKIVFLKKVPAGTPVSYQRLFTTQRESLLATLPVGYGDGLPIGAWRRGHVLIKGKKAPIAGLITMDMTMADVTGIAGAGVGDEAVVIGASGRQTITPNDWSAWARMSVYQLLCGFGTPRLPKVYRCAKI